MSSQRNSSVKSKAPVPSKKTGPTSNSPAKLLLIGGNVDSRGSNVEKLEKNIKGDSQAINLVNQFKDFSKVTPESVQENNMASDLNGSELSIIKMLEGETQHESREVSHQHSSICLLT